MALTPLSNTPGSATTAPDGATALNAWLAQIQTNEANITANTSAIAGLNTNSAQVTALVPQHSGLAAPVSFQDILGQIDPRTYVGYDNTGTLDQTTIFNSCIQAAIAVNYKFKIPAGKFLINGMLICNALGATSGRSSVYISGQGTAYTAYTAVSYAAETILISGNGQLPIMSINNGYGTVIENIGFYGLNTAPNNQQPGNGYPIYSQAAYVSAGISSNTYAPHAGLVIDAFNVATPIGGGYPGQAYGQNVGAGSSNILVRNCAFNNFVVGIACSIGGSGQACDNLKFESIQMTSLDTCYALCSANTHVPTIERGSWTYFRTGVNSTKWGGGLFNATPALLREVQVNWGYNLFEYSSSSGAANLVNVYMESMRTLGTFGGGGSSFRGTLSIIAGSLKINTTYGAFTVNPPPLYLETYGPTSIIGTEIAINDSTTGLAAFNIGGNGGATVMIEGGSLPGSAVLGQPPYMGVPFNQNFGSPRIKDTWCCTQSGGYNLTDDGLRAGSFNTITPSFTRLICTSNKRSFGIGYGASATEYLYIPGANTLSITVSALTLNSTTVTFTAANVALLLVGDVFMWQYVAQGVSVTREIRAGIQISSIVGSAVTCAMLWDPLSYDTVVNQPSTTSLQLLLPQWAPTQTLTAIADGSTAVLTGVSPTTCLKNGDFVTGTAGIPANSRVISGGGTATVTLNQNTTVACTTQLYFGQILTPQQLAAPTVNLHTSNYTYALTDLNNFVDFNGSSLTGTIPQNSSVAFPTGIISGNNFGSSTVSIVPSGSMVLSALVAGSVVTGTRTLAVGGSYVLRMTGINTAFIKGDIT